MDTEDGLLAIVDVFQKVIHIETAVVLAAVVIGTAIVAVVVMNMIVVVAVVVAVIALMFTVVVVVAIDLLKFKQCMGTATLSVIDVNIMLQGIVYWLSSRW